MHRVQRHHTPTRALFAVLLAVLALLDGSSAGASAPGPAPGCTPWSSLEGGHVQVCFAEPAAGSRSRAAAAPYLAAIRSARAGDRIDVAVFRISLHGIGGDVVRALNRATQRGARVRVVVDPKVTHAARLRRRLAGRVRACHGCFSTAPTAVMHNKFLLVRGRRRPARLVTGSLNLAPHQLRNDNDTTTLVGVDAVSAAYRADFHALWRGAGGRPVTGRIRSSAPGPAAAYFYPAPAGWDPAAAPELASLPCSPAVHVWLGSQTIDLPDIRKTLTDKAACGVSVGVFAKTAAGVDWAPATFTDRCLVPQAHDKLLVVTGAAVAPYVATGSALWTVRSHDLSDNNSLVLRGAAGLADAFAHHILDMTTTSPTAQCPAMRSATR